MIPRVITQLRTWRSLQAPQRSASSGVLRLVADGRSNAEVARTLYLSEATVKTYVSRMLTKLDLRDRLQLAVLAYRTGLVRP